MQRRNHKNIIIGGLLAAVFIMTIGYAAFATQLNINGSAAITSNWCVGFDNTKTTTYTTTTGVSGATAPTGTMTYSGNTCATVAKTTATLNTSLHQPGDRVVYTLTILNKGNVDANIDGVTVDGVTQVSTYTTTKGNAVFTVTMPEDNALEATTGITTMTVTVEFQNTTNISDYTPEANQSITIGLEIAQDDGDSPAPGPTPETETIYAWNTTDVTIGVSTKNALVSTKTAQPYYTSAAAVMSASGYPFFNKYTVENDTITEGYSCQTFGILSEPVCVRGGKENNVSFYNYNSSPGNWSILNTLNSNATFTGAEGSCGFTSDYSYCYVGDLGVNARSSGSVGASDDDPVASCYVHFDGGASCDG